MLTLFGPMEFSIKFDMVRSGRSIVYIKGSQVITSKNAVFLSLMFDFVLVNSANPDEMPHHVVFHLDLHCLPRYKFRVFWSSKG